MPDPSPRRSRPPATGPNGGDPATPFGRLAAELKRLEREHGLSFGSALDLADRRRLAYRELEGLRSLRSSLAALYLWEYLEPRELAAYVGEEEERYADRELGARLAAGEALLAVDILEGRLRALLERRSDAEEENSTLLAATRRRTRRAPEADRG